MTDYHPVTKEELLQLRTKRKANPLGEGHGSQWLPMAWYELDSVMQEVLSRPDPLEILDKWVEINNHIYTDSDGDPLPAIVTGRIMNIIKQLRENPDGVRERGIKEGWWKND
jgi:inactivated superfamily I helicase